MTEKQENAVLNLVDRFLAPKAVKELMGKYDPIDKKELTKRLERVMRDSILGRNKEILNFAIATMIEKVDAL